MMQRTFGKIAVQNISGMAQQVRPATSFPCPKNKTKSHPPALLPQARSHDFFGPSCVASDRRKRKQEPAAPSAADGAAAAANDGTTAGGSSGAAEEAAMGYFTTLDPRMQEAIIEVARKDRVKAIAQAKIDMQEQLAYKQFRRQENLDKLLKATIERYANGLKLFTAWRAHGVRDWGTASAKLLAAGSEAEKLLFLRIEIEMRLIGLGWTQFETRWSSSSDETVGTVDNLSGLLKDILAHKTAERRLNNLPKEAAPPPLRMRTLKDLGTPSIDAEELAGRVRAAPQYPFPPRTRVPILPPPSHPQALFDADELKEKAEAERRRHVAAGISDDIEDEQPLSAPAFAAILDKKIEVCWPYVDTSTATPASASLSGARAS
jgi:hypothetical protein